MPEEKHLEVPRLWKVGDNVYVERDENGTISVNLPERRVEFTTEAAVYLRQAIHEALISGAPRYKL